MLSRLRALRVVHPFPSFLNAVLVFGIALVARGTTASAFLLAVGMLGIQFCIGAANDLHDARVDALSKPWKPLVAGDVSRRAATMVAISAALLGLLAASVHGPAVAAMAVIMLGCGLVYDFWLKPTPWAWACFSVAFATLPVYAWFGAVGVLPPLPQLLIPLAVLAGPALQLSNGLIDLDADRAAGVATLATRLGDRRSLVVIASSLAVIHATAWATLSVAPGEPNLLVAIAAGLAVLGLTLQSRNSTWSREVGWSLQAGGIALLGIGWLSAVA